MIFSKIYQRLLIITLWISCVWMIGASNVLASFEVIHEFGSPAAGPVAPVIQGSDGFFYGTTEHGGDNNQGTVYKVASDGSGFTIVYSFNVNEGHWPNRGLMQGSDGFLYGTTEYGGIHSKGTVFKVAIDGTGFTTLYNFNGSDGSYPKAVLIQGSDGFLYGTTEYGGNNGQGTVFKMAVDGTGFTTLYNFNGSDGAYPKAGLIQGSDGFFYGTTEYGGNNGQGTVFKMAVDGTGFATLYNFNGSDGAYPSTELTQGSDGYLYGTTYYGGSNGQGTVFKVAVDGTGFTTLYSFNGNDGAYPSAELIQGGDGFLYGTTLFGGSNNYGTIFKIAADGTNFTTLSSFNGSNGNSPNAALTQGSDGFFYGTTQSGSNSNNYLGTVFKVAADGTGFTTLNNFNTGGGHTLDAGLTQGSDGFFYGTTVSGGSDGGGTVFRVAADGTGFATLYSFEGSDGDSPSAELTQGNDGFLYGTTQSGGSNNYGTIFKIAPDGSGFATLYSFNGSDGDSPSAALTLSSDGFLYGTTVSGGSNNLGTIFKIAPDGTSFVTLFSFNLYDGQFPSAALTQGSDGFLYGTTEYGGSSGRGTIFKIAADGTGFRTLRSFNVNDGAYLSAKLMQGDDGFFYGTTVYGGSNGGGTVFKIAADGTGFTTLYSLSESGGNTINSGVIQGGDGFLYGTTMYGGSNHRGTLFKIAADGAGFDTPYNFFNPNLFTFPTGELTLGDDGAIYGAMWLGGTKSGGIIYRFVDDRVTQTITFGALASKVYGDAAFPVLATASSNLPVSFSASGKCTISGNLVTITGAGSCTITAAQNGDSNYYSAASVSQSFSIAKATPLISWAAPADITYGWPLTSTQLNASANVAGSFIYTPAAGTVLNAGSGQTLSVQFTPNDSTNYKMATASTTINVKQAQPVIYWWKPADITYGTPLSATQLNASTNVAGSFTYTPAAGTVLNAGAGQTLSVQFTPSNSTNYTTASASVTINVKQAQPTINWATPADITYGTPLSAAQLNASANVAGSFTYTPAAGTVLNAGAGQTLSAQFTPNDSTNYKTASASVTVNVLYAFTGFFSPVANQPAFNSMKAGNAVPTYFSLGGNKGLNIFAAGYPTSNSIACNSSAPVNVVKNTTTATSSSLTYSSNTGRYKYLWSTDRTWAGTCRRLTIKLIDGTEHYADFLFTAR